MSLIYFIFISLLSTAASANGRSSIECSYFLASLGRDLQSNAAESSTERFVRLIQYVARVKNGFSAQSLFELANQSSFTNPMFYISDIMTSEEKFSFSKAFSSLQGVDWAKARHEIFKMAQEINVGDTERNTALEETKPIFAPILLSWVNRHGFKLADYFLPRADMPFLTYEDGKIQLVDIKEEVIRPLSPSSKKDFVSFLETRNGEILVTRFDEVNSKIVVESARTGKLIGSSKVYGHNIRVERTAEDQDGNIKVIVRTERGFLSTKSGFTIYNITQGFQNFIAVDDRYSTAVTPSGRILGQTIDRGRTSSKQELNIVEFTDRSKKRVLLQDSILPFTWWHKVYQRFETLASGRVISICFDRTGEFVIYDIDKPDLKVIKTSTSPVLGDPDFLIEDQSGAIKIVSGRETFQSKRALELVGMDSSVDIIKMPEEASNQDFTFVPAPLGDGRTLILALGHYRFRPRTNPAENLYVIDPGTKTVTTLDLSHIDVDVIRRAQGLNDGRIIGLFTMGDKAKLLQIYGPLLETRGK